MHVASDARKRIFFCRVPTYCVSRLRNSKLPHAELFTKEVGYDLMIVPYVLIMQTPSSHKEKMYRKI